MLVSFQRFGAWYGYAVAVAVGMLAWRRHAPGIIFRHAYVCMLTLPWLRFGDTD